jgi:hypothetical protein
MVVALNAKALAYNYGAFAKLKSELYNFTRYLFGSNKHHPNLHSNYLLDGAASFRQGGVVSVSRNNLTSCFSS